jgi:uncharacterized protein YyaL (SSP411 family)
MFKLSTWILLSSITLALLLAATGTLIAADAAKPPSMAAHWGAQTLDKIQLSFYLPQRSLYAEMIDDGKKPHPAWIWDASMELSALCAAARLEPREYLPRVRSYAAALRAYRTMNHDRPGLDVNPPPKNPDRYYDDNAWISLALLETYDLTHDSKDLELAADAYSFAMSGEDSALGGGIYWHEDKTESKNACSSGPAMLAALQFYHITREQRYLEAARRLYDWTRARLQDKDGLVFDSISLPDGVIAKAKYSYNSATLLRASCILHRLTHEQHFLDEAQRIAQAAEKRFVRQKNGIIAGAGKLGVKLIEALLELYQTDHDDHWRQVVARCLNSLRQHRDENGWYAQDWQADSPPTGKPARLIDQAAPARAYWIAAEHGVELHQ